MVGRAITVVVGALLVATQVVRSAFVAAYANKDLAKAEAIWPGHPSVILAEGLSEIGSAAAAGQSIDPATVKRMVAMAAKAPLAPEPFLVRGVEAQVAGNGRLALQAFLEARRRNPRSVAAHYFLADQYLKSGQTRQGLAEISALTRLVPESLGGIAPQLAAFARIPGGARQVRLLLRDQPELEPWLLGELAKKPEDANLALSLWSGRVRDEDQGWQQRLLASLVSAGRFEEARKAWNRFDPGSGSASGLADPRFEIDAMPPFGWTLASGPAGVAEPQAGGQLHILFYGRDNLVMATQLLTLEPGQYRLAMRVSGAQPSAKSLSWVVRCISPQRDIASVELASAKGVILAAGFSVPPEGCVAQQLELVGIAPELPEQADLTIRDLSPARRGR
jgi:hypothetical protein